MVERKKMEKRIPYDAVHVRGGAGNWNRNWVPPIQSLRLDVHQLDVLKPRTSPVNCRIEGQTSETQNTFTKT